MVAMAAMENAPLAMPKKITLALSGHAKSIDAIADDEQRGMVQIEWDDSQVFERSRPALIALAAALGMADDDLDNLFRLGAVL